jgi:hypothetical protein
MKPMIASGTRQPPTPAKAGRLALSSCKKDSAAVKLEKFN